MCRITSLYPPDKSCGGTGLYEYIVQQEAESKDPTGELGKQRREKEAAERATREEEKQKEAERVYQWQLQADDEGRLAGLLGDEALASLKTLWEQGPHGWTNAGEGDGEDPAPVVEEKDTSSRGARGGRGGRGRGGSRGGRRGGDGRGGQDPRSVMSKALAAKEERTAVHQLIRELFASSLTTDTVETASTEDASVKISTIRIRWASNDPGRMRFDRRGEQKQDEPPPYIHFLLQKTNRESQDAMNIVAKALGLIRPGMGGSRAMRDLSVAGTKDKRAVTVQKVALRRGRRDIDEVWKLLNGVGKPVDAGGRGGRGGRGGGRGGSGRARTITDALRSRGDRGIRAGHLEYAHDPLHLGQLQGNEFVIVLREVHVKDRNDIDETIDVLTRKGFINYYGMQRFGTSVVSTHTVGIALLRNDFKTAIELIMAPRPGDTDEVQEAREAYEAGNVEKCLQLMPHHNIPERAILQRIAADKQSKTDWQSYFMAIPRALRTMYVHAYQSYIWNRMVTERVRRFGLDAPVVGDMVLLDGAGDVEGEGGGEGDDAVDGDLVGDDDAQINGVDEGAQRKRVKVLESEDEVGQYTIHDVVMPLPGNEIQLSEQGWMAQVYGHMLAEDALTPADVGESKTPEFALKGDYRKVLHLPRNVSYELLRYRNANANLCQSDEDEILGLDAPSASQYKSGDDEPLGEDESVAMVLRLTLGVSAYATMALREVLKQDTSVAHQKELTERADRHKSRHRSPPYRNEAVNKIQGKQARTWGAPKAEAAAATQEESESEN